MPPPKARTCYICGRPTLLPGYERHVEQCRDLFEKREALKPPKERRACPVDPMLYARSSAMRSAGMTQRELDEANEAAERSWQSTLTPCQFCGRKFLPDKLPIHNRSCTASNPAKRVHSQDAEMSEFVPTASYSGKSQLHGAASGQYDMPDGYNDFPTYGHLLKCKECGRNFNENSYEKHVKICKKVFQQKRKPFDAAKHRAEGTELEQYNAATRRVGRKLGSQIVSSSSKQSATMNGMTRMTSSSAKSNAAMPKWKAESLSFRNAIQQARLVSKAEQKSKLTGIPLQQLLPAQASHNSYDAISASYIQCPHCGRSYNQKAAERHIPKCQSIINKPTTLIKGSGIAAHNPTYSPPSKYEEYIPHYDEVDLYAQEQARRRNATLNAGMRSLTVSTSSKSNSGSGRYSTGNGDSGRIMAMHSPHNVNDPVRLTGSRMSTTSSGSMGRPHSGRKDPTTSSMGDSGRVMSAQSRHGVNDAVVLDSNPYRERERSRHGSAPVPSGKSSAMARTQPVRTNASLTASSGSGRRAPPLNSNEESYPVIDQTFRSRSDSNSTSTTPRRGGVDLAGSSRNRANPHSRDQLSSSAYGSFAKGKFSVRNQL